MKPKLDRLTQLSKGRATMPRIVTEIINDGWHGWSGTAVTTPAERRGLKEFACKMRAMRLDSGDACWRLFSGGKTKPLPLP